MQKFLDEARKYMGAKEIPGLNHSPWVLSLFKRLGHGWVRDDETAWCAAFVGNVLENCGVQSTKKLNARSYLTWGHEVPTDEALPGDIVVFWRGKPTTPQGHVAFFVGWDDKGNPKVLGGNQSNMVCVATYPRMRVLSVRRA